MLLNDVGIKEHDLKWMKPKQQLRPPSTLHQICNTTILKIALLFCQMNDGQDLFTVQTENVGKELQRAVEISQNQVLMAHLSNAISPGDTHAIDV